MAVGPIYAYRNSFGISSTRTSRSPSATFGLDSSTDSPLRYVDERGHADPIVRSLLDSLRSVLRCHLQRVLLFTPRFSIGYFRSGTTIRLSNIPYVPLLFRQDVSADHSMSKPHL